MQIAMSTVCLPEYSWQDTLKEIARAGFAHAEVLMIPGWVHLTPEKITPAELEEFAQAQHLDIVALHAGALDSSNEEQLAQSLAYIDGVVRFAAASTMRCVVCNGMPVPPGSLTAEQREEAIKRAAQGVRRYLPVWEQLGVTIALENHYHFLFETAQDYRTFFAYLASPANQIGMTLDTGHYIASQVDPLSIISEFGTRIRHVHVKDHLGTQSVALGQGQTDLRAIVPALRETNYQGYLSVEMELADREHTVAAVHAAYGYMQKLVADGTDGPA